MFRNIKSFEKESQQIIVSGWNNLPGFREDILIFSRIFGWFAAINERFAWFWKDLTAVFGIVRRFAAINEWNSTILKDLRTVSGIAARFTVIKDQCNNVQTSLLFKMAFTFFQPLRCIKLLFVRFPAWMVTVEQWSTNATKPTCLMYFN